MKEYGTLPVPLHLRNAPTGMMGRWDLVRNIDILTATGAFVEQEYLPSQLKGKTYFHPHDRGYEKTMKERLRFLWKNQKY